MGISLTAALLALALLGYYFSPHPILAVAAGGAFAVLAWRRLDLALLAVPATAPLYLYPKELGGLQVSLVEFVTLVCLAVWVVRRLSAREWKLPPDAWLPPSILVVAALAVVKKVLSSMFGRGE